MIDKIDKLIEGILGPSSVAEPAKRVIDNYIDIGHIPSENPSGVILWWYVEGQGFKTRRVSERDMPSVAHFDYEREMDFSEGILAYGRVEIDGPYGSVQFYPVSRLQKFAILRALQRRWPDKIFYDFSGMKPQVVENIKGEKQEDRR
jgi:hypothetical protein